MVKNASRASSMNVPSADKANASPAKGEKNTKDADTNLKDELVDLLGKNVVTQYYTKKLLFDKYYDKMLKRKKSPKIIKCKVLTKNGPITLKIYREYGSDEVISNIKRISSKEMTSQLSFNNLAISQSSLGDEEDTISSHEYLNDLEKEYQARALLAKSKRFFKKEEVSSDDNEMVEVKVLMALAEVNDVVSKEVARNGNEEVIFDVDQSIKRRPTKDDECYGIDYLDTTVHSKTQELLEYDQLDSFLVNNLEKSIDLSDLGSCGKDDDGSESKTLVRHIEHVNTSYSESQETNGPDKTQNEHLYSASPNKIDKKRPDLKDLPSHVEYAYLKGDESCPVIISSKLAEKEKILLLHVLEKRKGTIAWKMSDIKGIRFFQIPIAPEDQEKTTFTCPYRTFAYRRMSFGLCNAPATFQRCMTIIFHDMMEDFMEVFMDDFSVFGIVLGYKIYGKGIKVDKAKIDVIAKLPYPTNVKGVRSFLRQAGFYRRFIKDFSMISKRMTQLLMKDTKFDFSKDCNKAFNKLKKLTIAPIIISPDWNVPFELMCDVSDFAVGTVFGQRIDGKFKHIYYASKTLNDTQAHYTTTEKELLVVVFSVDKFCLYLILSKTIVYTDHSALKYLFKNLVGDHLSRLENPNMGELAKEEIADKFPDEHLMILKAKLNDVELEK
nr:DNA-directed DNA polymerase [Tanacetum cinerariifolium]